MEESSTERFFRLMNEANTKIAEAEANTKPNKSEVGDPVRLERMEARRERLGQLRARPHSRSKQKRVTNVFDHIDLSH